MISKFQVGLKSILGEGLSEPEFYGDFVYKLKMIVGSNNFSAQFIKIISHYKKIGYNINVLQQTACLVVNPITVGNFAFPFNCTPVGRTSDYITVPIKDLWDEMVGAWCFGCLSGPRGLPVGFILLRYSVFFYCRVLIFAVSPCYILIYMF